MNILVPDIPRRQTIAEAREIINRAYTEASRDNTLRRAAGMPPLTGRERQLAALRAANEARKAAAAALRAENPGAYTSSGRRSRAKLTKEQRTAARRRTAIRNNLSRSSSGRRILPAVRTIERAYAGLRERQARNIADIMSYDIEESVPTRRNRIVVGPRTKPNNFPGVNKWNITPISSGFDENMTHGHIGNLR